jgi:uncharacterized damage-inducible protein DinB
MTHYGGKEMAASFRTVRKNTIQIANDIPEDKYEFRPAPDTRRVAQLLMHIGLATRFPLEIHTSRVTDFQTLNFQDLVQRIAAEEAKSRTKAEILTFLETEGDRFASFLEGTSDAFLAERVAMMPGADPAFRTRFDMLLSAKEHEMHHRGQLMLVERMVGVVPHLTRQMQERMARMQSSAR